MHTIVFTCILLAFTTACNAKVATQSPAAPIISKDTSNANTSSADRRAESSSISVQEMLISGPSQLKMHSLAMISQGHIKGQIDESYLPGFKACSEDKSPAVRSMVARLLGQQFAKGKLSSNIEAEALMIKLAKDKYSDVRYNAIYHGLTQVEHKSPELIEVLVDIAAKDKQPSLEDRIVISLAGYKPQVIKILDQKLLNENALAYYEVYEVLTGETPKNAEHFLDMPSSRPRLFIFNSPRGDPTRVKAELVMELKDAGISSPNVIASGDGANFALMIKTRIIKDGIAVEKHFSGDGKFNISQQIWLTPEIEAQIDTLQK